MTLRKLLFLIFSFNISVVFSQKVTLEITTMRLPVPYVTVIDSAKGIVGISDSSGLVKIKAGNCYLTLSHVSFKEIKLNIPNVINDTIIKVVMYLKSMTSGCVRVISEKINKKKHFQIGSYNHVTSSSFLIREKLLMGVKFPNFYKSSDPTKYLRSIKFKLRGYKSGERDFVLEFKIYKFNDDGKLETEPLNRSPIYVKATDLKNRNEIMIDENIKIPKNDILISVELPESFNRHYDWIIPFVGDFTKDIPTTFVIPNRDGKWNDENLKTSGLKLENGKYFAPNFSLTYWNKEKKR